MPLEQTANASGRPRGAGTASARFHVLDRHWARTRSCSQGLRPKPPRGQEGGREMTLFPKRRPYLDAGPVRSPAQQTASGAAAPLTPRKQLPAGLRSPRVRTEVVTLTCLGLLSRSPGGPSRPGRGRLSLEPSPERGLSCRFTKLMCEHFTERSAGSHVVRLQSLRSGTAAASPMEVCPQVLSRPPLARSSGADPSGNLRAATGPLRLPAPPRPALPAR